MNAFTKFFHELLNPHCLHCEKMRQQELEQREMDREVSLICNSCEALKMQLAVVNQQNQRLIDKLIKSDKESVSAIVSQEPPRILQTNKHVPFSVTRQRLEAESRLRAAEMRQKIDAENRSAKPDTVVPSQIKELEQSIGISNAPTGTSET